MANHRFTVSVDEDTYQRLKYWSASRSMSLNEYVNTSIDHMIRYENRDYDLPTAEINRLNQLTDHIVSLSHNVGNLEKIVVSGFDSLIGLTRGDNYLLDDDGSV